MGVTGRKPGGLQCQKTDRENVLQGNRGNRSFPSLQGGDEKLASHASSGPLPNLSKALHEACFPPDSMRISSHFPSTEALQIHVQPFQPV